MEQDGTGNGRSALPSILKAVARGIAEQASPLVTVKLDNQTPHRLTAADVRWKLVDGRIELTLTIRETDGGGG